MPLDSPWGALWPSVLVHSLQEHPVRRRAGSVVGTAARLPLDTPWGALWPSVWVHSLQDHPIRRRAGSVGTAARLPLDTPRGVLWPSLLVTSGEEALVPPWACSEGRPAGLPLDTPWGALWASSCDPPPPDPRLGGRAARSCGGAPPGAGLRACRLRRARAGRLALLQALCTSRPCCASVTTRWG